MRTKTVGHIRDVRRLIVAMSRARLGLYIFGRIGLFQNCFELGPSLRLLTARPTQLMVAPDEVIKASNKIIIFFIKTNHNLEIFRVRIIGF